jgi:hypothetical protein
MRSSTRGSLFAGMIVTFSALCGCGGQEGLNCSVTTVVSVSPTSAEVNHAASPPANQVQFVGSARYEIVPPVNGKAQSSCAVPELSWIVDGTWSNPDPDDIQISSAANSTNGTAVCVAPTNGPVTLTGTFSPGNNPTETATESVNLTCE